MRSLWTGTPSYSLDLKYRPDKAWPDRRRRWSSALLTAPKFTPSRLICHAITLPTTWLRLKYLDIRTGYIAAIRWRTPLYYSVGCPIDPLQGPPSAVVRLVSDGASLPLD